MIRVLPSALKHGFDEPTILSAFHHPIYTSYARSNPLKVLLLGVSTDMQTIEIAYTVDNEGNTVIFHAMKAPKAFINQAKRAQRRN